jgi:hypothetical protein
MGQHWYSREGKPCHYQEDGKDTTLRHARKQDLVPSVTGILNQVDKPGLTKYLINQTMEAASELPFTQISVIEGASEADIYKWEKANYLDWCDGVKKTAGAHSKNARDKGSAIHKALEDDANEIVPSEHQEIVLRVTEALSKEFGDDAIDLVPEATFSHRLGYGGAVDKSSPGLILDYKYKADGLKKKMVYDTHIGQLAAYRCGLGYPQAECGNVFISDTEVEIVMIPEKDLVWGFDYFQLLLGLWKHTKKFNSGYLDE